MTRPWVDQTSVGDTLRGALELTRPANCVAAGVLTATGAFVAGASGALVPAGLAVTTTVAAVAAGNAVNDYFDRNIDAINRPDRPIPRGAISARGALVFSMALFASAIGLAASLPPAALGLAAANLVGLLTYTTVFKGTPGLGNVLVSALVGSTFLFGGAAVGRLEAPVILAVLAMLSTLTREIIKDVEDVAGDREEGLATLPIAIGERRALWVGAGALGVAVAVSPVPYLLGTFGAIYLGLVVIADTVMLYAWYESFADPAAGRAHFKYGTFLATIAFAAGRAALFV